LIFTVVNGHRYHFFPVISSAKCFSRFGAVDVLGMFKHCSVFPL
jgi:hypothetical protein